MIFINQKQWRLFTVWTMKLTFSSINNQFLILSSLLKVFIMKECLSWKKDVKTFIFSCLCTLIFEWVFVSIMNNNNSNKSILKSSQNMIFFRRCKQNCKFVCLVFRMEYCLLKCFFFCEFQIEFETGCSHLRRNQLHTKPRWIGVWNM